MRLEREKDFIIEHMRHAINRFATENPQHIRQKTQYDLVTEIDVNIETYLSDVIVREFPGDKIHGEETSNDQVIIGRTWTIDPIDGTCNMAKGNPTYGIQCALFENGELMMAVIYLPFLEEVYWAIRGEGCYLNDKKISVCSNADLNNAVVSFGDYTHKNAVNAKLQHNAIGFLYSRIAKIRMFGAACVDFSFVAAGRTDGTVVITKNIWDIAPGILLCQEAGAIVNNLKGEAYHFGDEGVVVSCNRKVSEILKESFLEK